MRQFEARSLLLLFNFQRFHYCYEIVKRECMNSTLTSCFLRTAFGLWATDLTIVPLSILKFIRDYIVDLKSNSGCTLVRFGNHAFDYHYKSSLISQFLLLVFTYHVIKPKNRNHSINKITNKGYDR